MEFVKEINKVKWYNNSIGSSPARTIAGLTSFNQKVILIAGGYDKNLSYDEMANYVIDNVKLLILSGATKEKIKEPVLKLDKNFNIIECENLEECVNIAKDNSKSGDIVLLSPASASFDMYKNFEEKGNHFKDLVCKL